MILLNLQYLQGVPGYLKNFKTQRKDDLTQELRPIVCINERASLPAP